MNRFPTLGDESGEGRVRGVVQAEELLRAPLSGRPCVAWRVEVEELAWGAWHRKVLQKHRSLAFTLSGPNADIAVDASTPRLALAGRCQYGGPYHLLHWSRAKLQTFLKAAGVECYGMLGLWRSFSFQESILKNGDTVTVAGVYTHDEKCIRSAADGKLYICD